MEKTNFVPEAFIVEGMYEILSLTQKEMCEEAYALLKERCINDPPDFGIKAVTVAMSIVNHGSMKEVKREMGSNLTRLLKLIYTLLVSHKNTPCDAHVLSAIRVFELAETVEELKPYVLDWSCVSESRMVKLVELIHLFVASSCGDLHRKFVKFTNRDDDVERTQEEFDAICKIGEILKKFS